MNNFEEFVSTLVRRCMCLPARMVSYISVKTGQGFRYPSLKGGEGKLLCEGGRIRLRFGLGEWRGSFTL